MHWNIIKKFMRRQIGFLNYNLNKDLQNITKITLLNFYSQQLDKVLLTTENYMLQL